MRRAAAFGLLVAGLTLTMAALAQAQSAARTRSECANHADMCRSMCFAKASPGCLAHCSTSYKSCLDKAAKAIQPVPPVQSVPPAQAGTRAHQESGWTTTTSPRAPAQGEARSQGEVGAPATEREQGQVSVSPGAAPALARSPAVIKSECANHADMCRSMCFAKASPGCLAHCSTSYKSCLSRGGQTP